MRRRPPHGERRCVAAVAAATLVVAGLAACSRTSSHPVGPIADSLAAGAGSDGAYLPYTLRESMPGTTFTKPDGTTIPGSESVVLGTITDVGLAGSSTVDGGTITEATSAGSAMWSMATATVDVEQAWGELAGATTTTVSLPLRGPDPVQDQLASAGGLGRVVIFLTDGRIGRNDLLVAQVHEDGSLTFPVVDAAADDGEYPVDPVAFFDGIDTLDELRGALEQPAQDIAIDANGIRAQS